MSDDADSSEIEFLYENDGPEQTNSESAEMKNRLIEVDKEIKKLNFQITQLQSKKHNLERLKEKIRMNIQEEQSAHLAQKDWNRTDYSWSNDLIEKHRKIFKIETLRPHQLPTINATLSGTDCILIMPTGGGKSLCYQLPALVSKGLTLVVSPLISLMEDQLMGLRERNIQAKMLCAASPKEDVTMVHTAMTDPNSPLKLLYVTPEKLAKSKRFMSKLQKMHQMGLFARLAIDEVHCCSQWGHDFRPDYKFLGIMRKLFPGTPILGLTATATTRVIQDVQKILNLEGCLVLKACFNRPNLFYEVRAKPSVHKECVSQLANLLSKDFKGQSGIIYALSIKDTEELAKGLRNEGIKVAPYHASLDHSLRSKIHQKWVDNHYQAVVATVAFGMGIDKPNVRFVIHHCISKSMENFYQESGRAGRDDKPAKCIVFWRFADLSRLSTMVFTEQTGLDNLYGLISYCLNASRCRRSLIADHFDERWEASDCKRMCDHCSNSKEIKKVDLDKLGKQIISILKKATNLDQRLTGQKLLDVWLGKGPANLRIKEATATGMGREKAESVLAFLLVDGYLREDFHFTPYNTISYIVPGHKYEAGLAPSPMEISGARKKDLDEKNDIKISLKPSSNHSEQPLNTSQKTKLEKNSNLTISKYLEHNESSSNAKRRRIVIEDSSSEEES